MKDDRIRHYSREFNVFTQKNFREILDYQKAVLLDKEGLFLPALVDVSSMPGDINYYYIQHSKRNGYFAITKDQEMKSKGMFFTKESIDFKDKIRYISEQKDLEIKDYLSSPDDFYDFFNVRLSLDKRISLADASRFYKKTEKEH